MAIYTNIIVAFWVIFILYWFISGMKAKKNTRSGLRTYVYIRIVAFIFLFIIFSTSTFRSFDLAYQNIFFSPAWGALGVILTALGLAFAVWARVYLGRNWGMPMSLKENVELVTTGPYAYVRHPIYTGMIVAVLGSALVAGAYWIAFFVFFSVYFIFSARTEEKIMTEQFPDQYPEYKKRTKMLIPFVF